MPSALFFILKIALALWGLLWFSTNFRIACSICMKILLKFWYGLHWICILLWRVWSILPILILPFYEHGTSSHLFVSSSVFLLMPSSFQYTRISLACLNLFLDILFFLILNRIVFLISLFDSYYCKEILQIFMC